MRAGFPHSEIRGSKLVCQLPAAYRRLQRPSSPVIAKASTTCTCSLDPITLSPRRYLRELLYVSALKLELQVNSCLPHPKSFCALRTQRYNLYPSRFITPRAIEHPRFATNRDLYFFRIFKERTADQLIELSVQRRVHNSTLNTGLLDWM